MQGDTDDAPGNVIMQYDLEPLPPDLTNEQRFFKGAIVSHAFVSVVTADQALPHFEAWLWLNSDQA